MPRPRLLARAAGPLLLGLAVAACSLTRPAREECATNADCAGVFGPGAVCAEEGLCATPEEPPRCRETEPPDLFLRRDLYRGAIVVGVLMDRSVETQVARERAVRLAVRQVAEEQGLDGRPFAAVFCDVAKNPDYDALEREAAAVEAARHLANDLGARTVIGPSASTDAVAVFEALRGLDTVLLTPAATSPALFDVDERAPTDETPGMLWRTAPSDTLQGLAISRYLERLEPAVPSLVIVQEKGAYGDALASLLEATWTGAGRQVTRRLTFETQGQRDAAIVDAGALRAPWVVFASSQTSDAVALVNAAATLTDYASTRIFLTDSAANQDFLNGTGGSPGVLARVNGSRPAVPSGIVYDQFRVSYQAAFQQNPTVFSFVANTYDAAWLAFFGAAASSFAEGGVVTGRGVARGLRRLSSGAEVPIRPASWKQVVDELRAGRSVDVTGASGALDFDPRTEEATSAMDIWGVTGGAVTSVATIDPR